MNCLHAMAPGDDQLVRLALDGELLPALLTEHLNECTSCQQRFERYKAINAFLLKHLYRSECPDVACLSLYCTGMLPADESIHITRHLQQCPLCTEEALTTRQFLS